MITFEVNRAANHISQRRQRFPLKKQKQQHKKKPKKPSQPKNNNKTHIKNKSTDKRKRKWIFEKSGCALGYFSFTNTLYNNQNHNNHYFFFCRVFYSTVRTGSVLVSRLVLNSGYSQVELEYVTSLQIKMQPGPQIIRKNNSPERQFPKKTPEWKFSALNIVITYSCNCRYKMSMHTKWDNWW